MQIDARIEDIKALEEKLALACDAIERAGLMLRLAQAYNQAQPRQLARAIAFSESASEEAQRALSQPTEPEVHAALHRLLIESLQNLGEFYIQMAHFDMALSFLFRALSILKEQDQVEAESEPLQAVTRSRTAGLYMLICRTYSYLGEYPAALEYALKGLQIYRQELAAQLPLQPLAVTPAKRPRKRTGEDAGQEESLLAAVSQSPIVRQLYEDEARALVLVGEMHLRVGNVRQAYQALEESVSIARQCEAEAVEASALENLVKLFVNSGSLRAETKPEHPATASSRREAPQDQARDDTLLAKRGQIQSVKPGQRREQQVEGQAAREWVERCASLYRQLGDQRGEARTLVCQGELLMVTASKKELTAEYILPPFLAALELAQKEDFTLEINDALFKLGQAYHCLGLFPQALEVLNRALEQAVKSKALPDQFQCHQWLARVERDAGHFEPALIHYEQYMKFREAVFNQQAMDRLRNLQALHQVENARREAELSDLKNTLLQQEILERTRAEQALKVANEQLRVEMAQREQLIADLDAFASMVAHDLKSPLTNLALSNKLLQIEASRQNNLTALDLVSKSQQTVNKMSRIISELLLLASVRQERVLLAELDSAAILNEVLERLDYLSKEFAVEIEFATPVDTWPVALGYAAWVEEVWANYVSNAITYGGRPPKVILGAERMPDQIFVRFWVQDNGEGISPEVQKQLFKPFGRLPGKKKTGEIRVTQNVGGQPLPARSTGLGLSIVRRIVQKLGGTTGVESSGQPGEGSRFYFTLPGAL